MRRTKSAKQGRRTTAPNAGAARATAAAVAGLQLAEARRTLRASTARGYLFVASEKTYREVLEKQLFGLPQPVISTHFSLSPALDF